MCIDYEACGELSWRVVFEPLEKGLADWLVPLSLSEQETTDLCREIAWKQPLKFYIEKGDIPKVDSNVGTVRLLF